MLQAHSAVQKVPGESKHTYFATLPAAQNPCLASFLILLTALDSPYAEGHNLWRQCRSLNDSCNLKASSRADVQLAQPVSRCSSLSLTSTPHWPACWTRR